MDIRRVFAAADFGEEFTPESRAQEAQLRAQSANQKESRHAALRADALTRNAGERELLMERGRACEGRGAPAATQ